MATSGTYAFNPSNADLVLEAYSRCGIRANLVDVTMLIEGAQSANYVMASWANRGVFLWVVDLKSVVLTASVGTLTLDPDTTQILTAYIETGSPATGLLMSPIDRDTYAAIPNKLNQGRPTQYWLNRVNTPILTLWPVPDASITYTLKYYRFRRLQDVGLTMAQTADVNYRYLEAFAAALAVRLAVKYAPERVEMLLGLSNAAFTEAYKEDQEEVTLRLAPDVSAYFRS
jgi:hypothetical protein